jgi:flagellar biosynthesis GTPase FlhF
MAFNLSPDEHQKVTDDWKPSYTDAQYKAFCYLLDNAENKSIRESLGPSLDRYSPENLFEMVSETRFMAAVQSVVSDYAQDSHRGRTEGPEYNIPDFWDNIKELGTPSQFFWTDLQVTLSDLQQKAWYTVARIYDINDKPTPEEEERYKQLHDKLKKTLELPLDVKIKQEEFTDSVDKELEENLKKKQEREAAMAKMMVDLQKDTLVLKKLEKDLLRKVPIEQKESMDATVEVVNPDLDATLSKMVKDLNTNTWLLQELVKMVEKKDIEIEKLEKAAQPWWKRLVSRC